jgi:hypothetical protein
MNTKTAGYISLLIILVFIAFIIYDSLSKQELPAVTINEHKNELQEADKWHLSDSLLSDFGDLRAVAITDDNNLILGGDSFVACYDEKHNVKWSVNTPVTVTALCTSADTIFASTRETLLLVREGKIINEYGPYDEGSVLTGTAANKSYIAIADAANKLVFILRKSGELKTIIGRSGKRFIIPSPYFDVALTADNRLIAANTGERNMEFRTLDDKVIGLFGESGTAPGSFCGCCNPAHFALCRDGIVTAEKGINRIKMMSTSGQFTGFVSSINHFRPSIPLDVAVTEDGRTVFAANPVNSQLYIFEKNQ